MEGWKNYIPRALRYVWDIFSSTYYSFEGRWSLQISRSWKLSFHQLRAPGRSKRWILLEVSRQWNARERKRLGDIVKAIPAICATNWHKLQNTYADLPRSNNSGSVNVEPSQHANIPHSLSSTIGAPELAARIMDGEIIRGRSRLYDHPAHVILRL